MEDGMSDKQSSDSIVNESQVFGWQHRVREIDEEIKSLDIEKEKLTHLISMAEELASAAGLLAAATRSDSSHPKFINEALQELETSDAFPKAVMAIVSRAEDGASYDDIREAILQSPLAKRFQKSDKGFYHALRRLKNSGDLVDYHTYVFTPDNLKSFLKKVAAGLKEDKAADRGRATIMMDLILDVIARNPGIIAKEVIALIRKQDGELDDRLSNNDGSAYNAIARFKKRGVIEGFGHLERQLRIGPNASEDLKRLARSGRVVPMPKRTEAPSDKAAGASGGRDYPSLPFPPPAGPRH
jgi:hypothetical protein